MSGDVLLPILVTLLVVNVVLAVRVVARRQLRRPDVATRSGAGERGIAPGAEPGPRDAEAALATAPAEAGAPKVVAEPGPALVQPVAQAFSGPAHVQPVAQAFGRDPLTGLDDRAAWDRRVADESARSRRYRRSATIISIELDGLDRLDGLLGQEAGDRLVLAMADTLRRLARDTDTIARVGRGGFAVLMPETSADAATRYVERVGRACTLWLESAATTVRLAIGWAAGSGDVDLVFIERLAVEVRRVDPWRQPE